MAPQPPPPSSSAPGPTVLVERPPPGLARGLYEGSPSLVLALGLAFAAIGSTYLVWRAFRWFQRHPAPPTES